MPNVTRPVTSSGLKEPYSNYLIFIRRANRINSGPSLIICLFQSRLGDVSQSNVVNGCGYLWPHSDFLIPPRVTSARDTPSRGPIKRAEIRGFRLWAWSVCKRRGQKCVTEWSWKWKFPRTDAAERGLMGLFTLWHLFQAQLLTTCWSKTLEHLTQKKHLLIHYHAHTLYTHSICRTVTFILYYIYRILDILSGSAWK